MDYYRNWCNEQVEKFAARNGLELERGYAFVAEEEDGELYLDMNMVELAHREWEEMFVSFDDFIEENELDEVRDCGAILERFEGLTFYGEDGQKIEWVTEKSGQACLVDWEEYLNQYAFFMAK